MEWSTAGDFATSTTASATGNSHRITGLAAATAYHVRVKTNRTGFPDSRHSAVASVDTEAPSNRPPAFSPTTQAFTINENAPAESSIGTARAATDPEGDALTYSASGDSNISFDAATRELSWATGFSPDHETSAQHSVTVTASDGRGGMATLAVVVTIRDLNETPSFPDASYSRAVNENSNTGTAVGAVQSSATDPDDSDVTLGYTLSGTGATLFNVSGTGQITVASGAASLDHEAVATYSLTLTVQGRCRAYGHSRGHHHHQGRERIPVHP